MTAHLKEDGSKCCLLAWTKLPEYVRDCFPRLWLLQREQRQWCGEVENCAVSGHARLGSCGCAAQMPYIASGNERLIEFCAGMRLPR